jgi:HD-GYP domain-containing protein (c-di-GMP phosphodiesterase class II)/DNA-binding CsgD family transcriptional regulator
MAEVLAALSLATDLGTGKTMGHALRACYVGMELAASMRLSTAEQAELYYSFLLMHSGCTALSLRMAPVIEGDEVAAIGDGTLVDDANLLETLAWISRHVSPDAPPLTRAHNLVRIVLQGDDGSEALRGACEVATRVAQRLGLPLGVQDAVRHYLERWDGKGPNRLRGSAIPLCARLLHAGLKIETCYTERGRHEAESWVRAQKGKILDPEVAEAFLAVAKGPELWEKLAMQDLWDVVLDLEPASPYHDLDEDRVDDVARAVADFVDLKSPFTISHSSETARYAEGIARRMSLSQIEIVEIRRAALVHDLGVVALPSRILRNQEQLSVGDQERLRLHPYYTERALARVPALATVASIAGKHHERLDGTGYYRGLAGDELSVAVCILALADDFQDRMQSAPGQDGPDPKDVLKAMQPAVGTHFAPACFEALAQEFGVATPKPPRRSEWPAGLTGREVEVLRVVATGASNREIAAALVITEKTVAHHLEHIYNKIGISSRAAAVFFAMENKLLT